MLKKFLLDFEGEPDQHRFGLPLGLLVINIQRNVIADVFLRDGLHDHGRQQDLIADLVGEHQNAVFLPVENLAGDVTDHVLSEPPARCRFKGDGDGLQRGPDTPRSATRGSGRPPQR